MTSEYLQGTCICIIYNLFTRGHVAPATSSVLLMYGRLVFEQLKTVPLRPWTALNCNVEFMVVVPLSVRTAAKVLLDVWVNPTLSRGLMNAMYPSSKAELVHISIFPVTQHSYNTAVPGIAASSKLTVSVEPFKTFTHNNTDPTHIYIHVYCMHGIHMLYTISSYIHLYIIAVINRSLYRRMIIRAYTYIPYIDRSIPPLQILLQRTS